MIMVQISDQAAFKILNTPSGLVSGHLQQTYAHFGSVASMTATQITNLLANLWTVHTATCLSLTTLTSIEPLLNLDHTVRVTAQLSDMVSA